MTQCLYVLVVFQSVFVLHQIKVSFEEVWPNLLFKTSATQTVFTDQTLLMLL